MTLNFRFFITFEMLVQCTLPLLILFLLLNFLLFFDFFYFIWAWLAVPFFGWYFWKRFWLEFFKNEFVKRKYQTKGMISVIANVAEEHVVIEVGIIAYLADFHWVMITDIFMLDFFEFFFITLKLLFLFGCSLNFLHIFWLVQSFSFFLIHLNLAAYSEV